MIQCKSCGAVNPDSGKFCRNCGKPLFNRGTSSNHNFKAVLPSEEIKRQKFWKVISWVYFWFAAIITLIGIYGIKYWVDMYNEGAAYDPILYTNNSVIISCVVAILILVGCYARKNSKRARLDTIADYIDKKSSFGKHFFKKDNKLGLILMVLETRKVLVSAEYDEMQWQEKNRILRVSKDGETYLIDTTGYRLK